MGLPEIPNASYRYYQVTFKRNRPLSLRRVRTQLKVTNVGKVPPQGRSAEPTDARPGGF